MPILPPKVTHDKVEDSWKLDNTQLVNETERRLALLLRAISEATDLNDLKARIQNI